MKKPIALLSGLLSALLLVSCASPEAVAEKDELVFQVCLHDHNMASVRKLDFTTVTQDSREIEATMLAGMSLKKQPIFEAVAGKSAALQAMLLTLDNGRVWHVFKPPYRANAAVWSDWQAASYVTRSTDPAYKLQYGLEVKQQAPATALQIRYRIMRYQDVLAIRAERQIELPRTDLPPC